MIFMALKQPVVVYTASNNFDAHLVCGLLIDAGIPAMVVEDAAMTPSGWLGPVSNFIQPKIWIEKPDVERAIPILKEYDKRDAERRAAELGRVESVGPPMDVDCEECGKRSQWPSAQKGSVQNCPHCRAYIDIGDDLEFDDWNTVAEEVA
jgi:Putative prokaryotic signal transducing protein